jgi:hypothetical protein
LYIDKKKGVSQWSKNLSSLKGRQEADPDLQNKEKPSKDPHESWVCSQGADPHFLYPREGR